MCDNSPHEKNPSPHDATFRQFLTQPDIARDFMEIHLPAELRAICDLSTLKLESGSFFEDDLRHYFNAVVGFQAVNRKIWGSQC